MNATTRSSIAFGAFRLYPDERRLLCQDETVDIGSRAFDVLLLLLSRPGQTITHREFREAVWPQAVVEDVNLRVQITALRKILAKGLTDAHGVRSISGRGYCFFGPVSIDRSAVEVKSETGKRTTYPVAEHARSDDACALIGRQADIRAVSQLLMEKKVVSIVGPGGIGKTALAFVVMRTLLVSRPLTAASIELSPLNNGDHVASTVAAALGLLPGASSLVESIIEHLRKSPHLLLIDCCEHVIDAVASLVQTLNRSVDNLTILTTSREPLRIHDEWVYRIQPLEVPALSESKAADGAIRYSAVKLFSERAMSSQTNDFQLTDDNVQAICHICRSLDGLPLAIELAASQVHVFGVDGILNALDNRLDLLTRGQRTALPRHQTLRAAIDWSYDTLTPTEQRVLRRVALFKGIFTIAQVASLIESESPRSTPPLVSIVSLVDKSLMSAISTSHPPAFRLLDSTRTYGIEKLHAHNEYDTIARRHAAYFLSIFTEPARWSARHAELDALASDACILDDVRAALDWAFTDNGDRSLGIALTWACAPLFYQLSLFNEYRKRVDTAIGYLENLDSAAHSASHSPDDESAFRLQLSLAQVDFLTQSLTRGVAVKAFHSALALAEQQGHEGRQVQVLYGTIVMTTMAGEYQDADTLCAKLLRITRTRPADVPMYHRLQGLVDTQLGKVTSARQHIARSLSLYGPRSTTRKIQDPTRYDARAALTSLEARTLWLLGDVDDAATVAAQSVAEAMTLEHELSLCCSLSSGACPVACWRGDLDALREFLSMLDTLSTEYLLINWRDQAQCYGYALPERRPPEGHGWWRAFDHLAPTAHEKLASVNQRLLTPLAVERAKTGKAGWATAEIWRALGEQYLATQSHSSDDAMNLFRHAVGIAKQQGVLSWELRASTSLANRLLQTGEVSEAEDVLGDTLSRFKQGARTKDVMAARQLMARITTHCA